MSDSTIPDRPKVILVVDDDPDDIEMTLRALAKNNTGAEIFTVSDGEQLLDFLNHRGACAPPARSPTPSLILLDLNMPKMSGHEALAQIKTDPRLLGIPVVVMTTSTADQDIDSAYELGSNSFITKPITLGELTDITKVLSQYWFEVVKLPKAAGSME